MVERQGIRYPVAVVFSASDPMAEQRVDGDTSNETNGELTSEESLSKISSMPSS